MRKHIYKTLGVLFCIVGFCLAQDFLLPEPTVDRKRISGSTLKQEIAEHCALLLNQTSKQIELAAQVQQELYSRIYELTNSDKQAHLNRATRAELQATLKELKKLKEQSDQELAKLEKNIRFFKAGCKAV
jgi:hypothetical protein